MRRIHFVRTEYPSRRNHTDWKLSFFHLTHLNRRRLRAQENIVINIKRILFIFRRMVRRNIQRFKIIIIQFHFRPFHNFISHTHKNAFHFF